jgi:hypothetical protein
LAIVVRLSWNFPARVVAQICVNPRNVKVRHEAL